MSMVNLLDWACIKYLQRKGERIKNQNLRQLVMYSNDFIGYNLEVHGLYEKEYLEYFANNIGSFLKESSVFVDVGANIGNHSIFFSNYFNNIVCIEPSPRNFSLLKINCEGPKYTLYNYAASLSNGDLKFQHFSHNMGGSAVVKDNVTVADSITVRSKALDDLLKDFDKIDLIKIDVEGHELEVVKGGVNIIKKYLPIIIFEQNEWEVCGGGESCADFLADLGYTFTILTSNDPLEPCSKLEKLKRLLSRSVRGVSVDSVKVCRLSKSQTYPFVIAIHESK